MIHKYKGLFCRIHIYKVRKRSRLLLVQFINSAHSFRFCNFQIYIYIFLKPKSEWKTKWSPVVGWLLQLWFAGFLRVCPHQLPKASSACRAPTHKARCLQISLVFLNELISLSLCDTYIHCGMAPIVASSPPRSLQNEKTSKRSAEDYPRIYFRTEKDDPTESHVDGAEFEAAMHRYKSHGRRHGN